MNPRYQIKSKLSEDPLSISFEAWDTMLSRPVILISLKPESGESQTSGEFQKKYRRFATFKHPGSIEVYDFDRAEGIYSIVTEPLDGETLEFVCEEALISESDLEMLIEQTLSWAAVWEETGNGDVIIESRDITVVCLSTNRFLFKICNFEFVENPAPPKRRRRRKMKTPPSTALLASLVRIYCRSILGEDAILEPIEGDSGANRLGDLQKRIQIRRPDISGSRANWLGRLAFQIEEDSPVTASQALADFPKGKSGPVGSAKRKEHSPAGIETPDSLDSGDDKTEPIPLHLIEEEEDDKTAPVPLHLLSEEGTDEISIPIPIRKPGPKTGRVVERVVPVVNSDAERTAVPVYSDRSKNKEGGAMKTVPAQASKNEPDSKAPNPHGKKEAGTNGAGSNGPADSKDDGTASVPLPLIVVQPEEKVPVSANRPKGSTGRDRKSVPVAIPDDKHIELSEELQKKKDREFGPDRATGRFRGISPKFAFGIGLAAALALGISYFAVLQKDDGATVVEAATKSVKEALPVVVVEPADQEKTDSPGGAEPGQPGATAPDGDPHTPFSPLAGGATEQRETIQPPKSVTEDSAPANFENGSAERLPPIGNSIPVRYLKPRIAEPEPAERLAAGLEEIRNEIKTAGNAGPERKARKAMVQRMSNLLDLELPESEWPVQEFESLLPSILGEESELDAAEIAFLEKAATKLDSAAAARSLAIHYQAQNDIPASIPWWEKAAEAGDHGAMVEAGLILMEAEVDDPGRKKQGVDWLRRAAESGDRDGLYYLGECLLLGKGTAKNEPEAIRFLEQAAELEDARAADLLGVCYADGLGIEIDFKKARDFFEMSSSLGNESSLANLAVLYLNGEGGERDDGKAIELLRKGVAKENGSCLFLYGQCHEHGIGFGRDLKAARALYERAADAGSLQATDRLKSFSQGP